MAIDSIPDQCIQKLCAGQVITNLATCVKELVENSLDAGARNIEISFKNYGIDSLSVVDDGAGILRDDLPFLTKKHFTSKLKDFHDLSTVSTYGFRGEALFSITTVSKTCTIVSRHRDSSSELGMKMEIIEGKSSIQQSPGKVGTTITVEGVFSNYPVRHKEFQRSIKSQFADMLEILYGYALANLSVRFISYNTIKSFGSKQVVFQSRGSGNLMDCCGEIFSIAKLKSFIPFDFRSLTGPFEHCFGCLSKEMPASKSSIVLFNGRPCDYKKIPKAINDMFKKQFEPKGSVFFILHIRCKSNILDINVTPDKRKIFLQCENELITFLLKNFEDIFHHLCATNASKPFLMSSISQKESQPLKDNFSNFGEPSLQKQQNHFPTHIIQTCQLTDIIKKEARPNCSNSFSANGNVEPKEEQRQTAFLDISSFKATSPEGIKQTFEALRQTRTDFGYDLQFPAKYSQKSTTPHSYSKNETSLQCNSKSNIESLSKPTTPNVCSLIEKTQQNDLNNTGFENECITDQQESPSIQELPSFEIEPSYLTKTDLANMKVIGQFNLGFIIVSLLRNCITELYIVDQHAADEKYNFEKLFSNFNPTVQNLINPIQLSLSVDEELFVESNIDKFKLCGFNVVFNSSRPFGERVFLESSSIVDNVFLDSADFIELLYKMKLGADGGSNAKRLTKIYKLYASKACRKSIMIGQALSFDSMCKIITNMSQLNQPWNCPHGRPTIRLLGQIK